MKTGSLYLFHLPATFRRYFEIIKTLRKKTTDIFSEQIKRIIKKIPRGKVATYGQIAFLAGNHRGARQVVRILHACSRKEKLPWHRVINSKGAISLRAGQGLEEQRSLLAQEGVPVNQAQAIELDRFLWRPQNPEWDLF